MVQAVVLLADCDPTRVWVTSLAEQLIPLGAVKFAGVIVSVLAPVVPVQVICPVQVPRCVLTVAQAPVPVIAGKFAPVEIIMSSLLLDHEAILDPVVWGRGQNDIAVTAVVQLFPYV